MLCCRTMHRPMLATKAKVFSDEEWVYETKLDGWRCLAERDGDDVRLWSRQGGDLASYFPEVVEALLSVNSRQFVTDGEVCMLDRHGIPSLRLLQQGRGEATYHAFDLLSVGGVDARAAILLHRKECLAELVGDSSAHYVRHITGDGQYAYDAAVGMGHEGIVCKRADSLYIPGRSRNWRKCKPRYEALSGAVWARVLSHTRMAGSPD